MPMTVLFWHDIHASRAEARTLEMEALLSGTHRDGMSMQ